MPPNVIGGYVSCYAMADNYEQAIQRCLTALAADGLRVEQILQPINELRTADWALHIAEQWPSHAAQMPSQREFEAAIDGGRVVYGPFGTY